jgi:hypothetical protein
MMTGTMFNQDHDGLKYARLAGAMYLLGDIMLSVGDMITSKVAGDGSFIDTAHRIAASESLYRLGLACHVITTLSLFWLAVSFYKILKPVSPLLALVAMLCWVVESGISALINLFDFLSMRISLDAVSAPTADLSRLAELGHLADRASGLAFTLGIIVFSMGSILFYVLFLRSRYIPRAIAGFDLAASVLVAVIGFLRLLDPDLARTLGYGFIPMSIAEFGTGLWLLFMGARYSASRDHLVPCLARD